VISKRGLVVLVTSVLAAGCRIGPPYQTPATVMPAAFKEQAAAEGWKVATPNDALPKGNWWEVFGDPRLNELEALVEVNNENVKQAEAQFRQARALVAANRSNYYPIIGTSPSVTQTNVGPNTGRGSGTSQLFTLPLDATWEPDLWGRVRLSVEHAANEAQVSAADLENVRLSEQALLATDYFALAAADMQQTILHDTIEAYEKNLKLTVDRFNGGVASRADITLAQTQLAGAKAQSTDLRIGRAQFEHAIATLVGRAPPTPTSAWRRRRTIRRCRFRPTSGSSRPISRT
jgi:NodT family efflux transporter outer membrane factor (OMF) lipoprotein